MLTLIMLMIIIAIMFKIIELEPVRITLNGHSLPKDVFYKLHSYLVNLLIVKNIQVVSWDDSTKILEYDDGKRIYTLRLKEDGFHRIKGIDD